MECKLRIIRKGDSYVLQRKYKYLLFFHKWKTIMSSTAYGDVLLAQATYVPKEAFDNMKTPPILTSGNAIQMQL